MKRLCVIMVCIGLIFYGITASAQQSFNIMTEDIPPFNFQKDGAIHGISADLLLLMMEKAGYPTERSAIKLLPWPRAYKTVQEEPGSMLFSMARTDERENLFKWVGPIQEVPLGILALKSRKIVIKNLEEAKKYKIGTIRDNAAELILMKAGFDETVLDRIADPELNLKKLKAGRVDLCAFNIPTTRYMMLQMGMNPSDYEIVYTLKKVNFCFAFHKSTDDKLIEKLNNALAELKKPDTAGQSPYSRIMEKYLGKSDN
ncbi:MAG: transporter substrate-binding domain-containing protein [Desulfobacteraceae bacterium]|nr:transporter substrate-binding domain-containing protein [Desulfobacteraceae bacterium]